MRSCPRPRQERFRNRLLHHRGMGHTLILSVVLPTSDSGSKLKPPGQANDVIWEFFEKHPMRDQ